MAAAAEKGGKSTMKNIINSKCEVFFVEHHALIFCIKRFNKHANNHYKKTTRKID